MLNSLLLYCLLFLGNRWNHIENLDDFFERVRYAILFPLIIYGYGTYMYMRMNCVILLRKILLHYRKLCSL